MRTSTEKLINYIMLSFFAILVLAPFLWIATIAFKTQIDIKVEQITLILQLERLSKIKNFIFFFASIDAV